MGASVGSGGTGRERKVVVVGGPPLVWLVAGYLVGQETPR